MPALLIALVTFISSDLIKRLLIGAGIGLAASAVSKVILNLIVSKLIASFSGFPASILQLLGILGVDKFISIQIGAYAMAAAIIAMRLTFTAGK